MEKAMNPGKLNKKIEIQKFVKHFDSEGVEEIQVMYIDEDETESVLKPYER